MLQKPRIQIVECCSQQLNCYFSIGKKCCLNFIVLLWNCIPSSSSFTRKLYFVLNTCAKYYNNCTFILLYFINSFFGMWHYFRWNPLRITIVSLQVAMQMGSYTTTLHNYSYSNVLLKKNDLKKRTIIYKFWKIWIFKLRQLDFKLEI